MARSSPAISDDGDVTVVTKRTDRGNISPGAPSSRKQWLYTWVRSTATGWITRRNVYKHLFVREATLDEVDGGNQIGVPGDQDKQIAPVLVGVIKHRQSDVDVGALFLGG